MPHVVAYEICKKVLYKQYILIVFSYTGFHINHEFLYCIVVKPCVNDIVQLIVLWLLV